LQPSGPVRSVTLGPLTEELIWYEYNYKSTKNAFRATLRRAKLLRVIGEHVIFDKAPREGASGGCLWNTNGEAVGIVIWAFDQRVGVGLLFPEEWR